MKTVTINEYGYLDDVKVWVYKYYPEAACYSYWGINTFGFARRISFDMEYNLS